MLRHLPRPQVVMTTIVTTLANPVATLDAQAQWADKLTDHHAGAIVRFDTEKVAEVIPISAAIGRSSSRRSSAKLVPQFHGHGPRDREPVGVGMGGSKVRERDTMPFQPPQKLSHLIGLGRRYRERSVAAWEHFAGVVSRLCETLIVRREGHVHVPRLRTPAHAALALPPAVTNLGRVPCRGVAR